MKKPKLAKRVLPSLWVDEQEYAILSDLAERQGMSLADLVKDLAMQGLELADEELGKVIVIQVPHCTYAAFAEWVVGSDERAEDCVARFVANEAERLEEVRYAAASGQAGAKSKIHAR